MPVVKRGFARRRSGDFLRYGLVILISFGIRVVTCHAVTLTFSDQLPNSGPMDRGDQSTGNVYDAAQGLPPKIIATFTGFNRYGAFDSNKSYYRPLNHDHTGNAAWRALFAIDDTASIVLSSQAQIGSIWFDNSASNYPPDPTIPDPGYTLEIIGSLAGRTIWTYTYIWPPNAAIDGFTPPDNFQQITDGAGFAIDTLSLINAQDVGIDDITIASVPEPDGTIIALAGTGLLMMSRRYRYERFS